MAKGCDKQRVPEPTLRMQWVMATWCLKITQRLPLPAGGGHNPDAIHCRCIRTSCHVHWFAMTRTCIFMTGTLGVLEILMLFCQGQWNHSSILIVYIHIYIYILYYFYVCIYIYMYVCIHIYSTFHSSIPLLLICPDRRRSCQGAGPPPSSNRSPWKGSRAGKRCAGHHRRVRSSGKARPCNS